MGEAEDAAAEEARLLRDLVPYVIYTFDLVTYETHYLNRHVAVELGYPPESNEVAQRFLSELLHPDDAARLPTLLARWIDAPGDPVFETEYRVRHADGSWRWYLGRDRVLARDPSGRARKIIGTALDITARKQLEQRLTQAATLETLGRVAGGVAHDFNNLLTVILGDAYLARSESDPHVRDELLDEIAATAERGGALTRQLLGLVRPSDGQADRVDPNVAIRGLMPMLRRLVEESVELRYDLDEEAPVAALDPALFTRALTNLVVNARDAVNARGVVTIRTRRALHEGAAWLRLEVEDDGHGMSQALADRIFEPFFTTKGPEQGTGLGLAGLLDWVEQAGGRVHVTSEPGRGTRFEVWLRALEASTAPASDAAAPSAPRPRDRVVLLVEDDEQVARVVASTLTEGGYQVHRASSGAEATALLASRTVDLVLTDAVMPGESGLELTARLRALRPDLPVAIMTGHAHLALDGGRERVIVIQKPFTPTELLDVLAAFMSQPAA